LDEKEFEEVNEPMMYKYECKQCGYEGTVRDDQAGIGSMVCCPVCGSRAYFRIASKDPKKEKVMSLKSQTLRDFEKSHTQLVEEKDPKFIDISSEDFREYTFLADNGMRIRERVERPVKLHVSKSGGHRVFDKEGIGHYIPKGWIHLRWYPKKK